MSSSSSSSNAIAIPKRKGKGPASSHHQSHPRDSSSLSSSYNFTPSSSHRFSCGSAGSSYGSTPSPASGSPQSSASGGMRRRESLMSETFSRQEHIVIDVGEEDDEGGLRLITCVKASQGFDWNQEMFLPSHIDYYFDDLERRQDPVQDIIITDEEVRNMFPS